ncbi:NIF domain protein [Aspergillus aculeatinus CBS 121060]|uniref:HAD-like protein n=1 Tax=Aspergillus aculeatinus CBS 121060 TaxID=1448322 RepID=A0ACD1HAY1_9EURO|nr:HAD-like protein [Aspergillus aculeatinus CBS 121060]RAH70925.1 HAD-like protein [Aspergillus aculeatinus CBS 121060]
MLASRPAPSEYVKLDRMFRSGAVCISQPSLILTSRVRLSSLPRLYHRSYPSYLSRDSTSRSEMGTEGGFERGSNGTGRGVPHKPSNNANSNNPAPWRPYHGRWSSKTTHADQSGTQPPGNTSQDRPRRHGPRRNNRPADRRPKQHHGAIASPHGAAPLQSLQGQAATSHAGSMGNVSTTNPSFVFPPAPGVMNANGSTMPPLPFLMPNVPMPQDFFTQNMPEQQPSFQQNTSFQPQQQFTPMFNSSSYPSFGVPASWNDFTNFTSQLLPMPPPPLMNMGMPNPLLAMSMLDPLAFRTHFQQEAAPNQEQQQEQQQQEQSNNSRFRSCKPLTPPSPTAEYLQQSSLPPKRNESSKPLLVILDLNGTLVHRKHRQCPPSFVERAGLNRFRQGLLEKYKVMVWSSSQPFTVSNLCHRIFPGKSRKQLVAEWGRDKFPLTGLQYKSKTQVYKTLDTVWRDPSIQASYPRFRGKKSQPAEIPRWDQTNTILIDDSKLKAISEPYNILEIPEFTGNRGPGDNQTLNKVLLLLEELSRYDDVSQALHLWSTTLAETGQTCILDILRTLPRSQPQVPQEPLSPRDEVAKARAERRRARKQEKKAVRASAAAIATFFTAQAPAPALAPALAPTARSPSLATSLDSEHHSLSPDTSVRSDTQNDLLDKLEASLNRQD